MCTCVLQSGKSGDRLCDAFVYLPGAPVSSNCSSVGAFCFMCANMMFLLCVVYL